MTKLNDFSQIKSAIELKANEVKAEKLAKSEKLKVSKNDAIAEINEIKAKKTNELKPIKTKVVKEVKTFEPKTLELSAIEVEVLEKFKQKVANDKLEVARVEKVGNLVQSVLDLKNNVSDSVINELLSIAKAKDFDINFVELKSDYKNFCHYNGEVITTIKESGEISIKRLSFETFVKVFRCDFSNYLPKSIVKYSHTFDSTIEISSLDAYNRIVNGIIENYTNNASNIIELNLKSILSNNLQNKGLRIANRKLAKTEKLAKK